MLGSNDEVGIVITPETFENLFQPTRAELGPSTSGGGSAGELAAAFDFHTSVF
jgi:hypothetical protein